MKPIPFLSLDDQHRDLEPELHQAIQRVVNSNGFVLGTELKQFEHTFAAYCDTKFCAGVGSGFDALVLSLRALGISQGDEVVVPSNTYIATWLAVSAIGAIPVPVEPNVRTYTLDTEKFETSISKKTKAVIPVHLYGQPCDMTEVMRLAEKHRLLVVEDNAQAHGATWRSRKTGSFGHCNATSFYPTKNLGALGDGGAITTNDGNFLNTILSLRNYGSREKYHHDAIGVNSRLDELQAAILSVKIRYLADWNRRRQEIASIYRSHLNQVGDLILPQTTEDSDHVYHLFVVRSRRRDELQKFLANEGIQTLVHYPIPPYLQKAYAGLGYQRGDFPVAEELANTSLSLPIWPAIPEDSIARISHTIRKFFDGTSGT